MSYLTVDEIARKWCVSVEQVHQFLAENRIENVLSYGESWLIPDDAENPFNPDSQKPTKESLILDLAHLASATTMPIPYDNSENITLDERQLLQHQSILAYLRGDFGKIKDYYIKTAGDDAARLCISSVAVAAAISMGDYSFYSELETYLKNIVDTCNNTEIRTFSELCLATTAVSAGIPKMAPKWLVEGDFQSLIPQARPDAFYKRAKYFQWSEQYETMLAIAQTALSVYDTDKGISFHGIYYRILCGLANCGLGRMEDAKHWLLNTLSIALPHGFITPFAECATRFEGLLEQFLKKEFNEYYNISVNIWRTSFKNWITIHNFLTKDHINNTLSLREYQIAGLVVRGHTYKEIAHKFNLAFGTVKNIMDTIYNKLELSGKERRKGLEKLILWKENLDK